MNNNIKEEFSKYQEPFKLGRVIAVHKTIYSVEMDKLVYKCTVSGRFNYMVYQKSDYPVVGDYVIFKPSEYDDSGIIEKVCSRYSNVNRLGVGGTGERHLLATNVDIIFVCMSLNEDFRLKKLQNFLSLTYSSNTETIILLTKSDLCNDIDYYIDQVRKIDQYNDIMIVSIEDQQKLSQLKQRLENKTGVFIGSSGVGKSSIVNALLGYEHLVTKNVRTSDDQGRHATSHRELVYLDNGGAIIDTPGIRIVHSYIVDDINSGYKQVSELAQSCRFADCTHVEEPDCKVIEGLEDGTLPSEVYDSYKQTMRLNRYNQQRENKRKRMQDKRKRG